MNRFLIALYLSCAIVLCSLHLTSAARAGQIYAWGNNSFGQLGDGTTTNRLSPVPVNGLSGVKSVAGGGEFSLAVMSNGTVQAWGRNQLGQLGDGTTIDHLTPSAVMGMSNITSAVAGY